MMLQQCVEELIELVENDQNLKSALVSAIEKANQKEAKTLEEFYNLVDGLLTHIPTDKQLNPDTEIFWCILNQSPDDALKHNEAFQQWVRHFIMSMGTYMDSPQSVKEIETFTSNPKNNIDDYIQPPGGWQSYNQFLARQVKPGKRPVEEPFDDTIIVSPVDGKYLGKWEMEENATIEVKGDTYDMKDLLAGSPYAQHFSGGLFSHLYLNVHDYHRYHTPVAGTMVEKKIIPGRTWTNEIKRITGMKTIDDIGFQFVQTRGYIIIKTKNIGYVAVVPVGMGFVSSVTITPEVGSELAKGDEFGFFGYGGSDIILLFEKDKVKFTAIPNLHYLQGEKIAKVKS